MKRSSGFTLLEVMTAIALASMLFALVSYTTVQLSRTTRMATRASEERVRLIRACELIRWQLRGLFVPHTVDPGIIGMPASPTPSPRPAGTRRPPTLTDRALYARRGPRQDRDILLFRSTRLERGVGAAEVGFRILDGKAEGRADSPPYLAYRQYPWADATGLHDPDEDPEAPWKPLSREITGLRLEFSGNGETWQREWDAAQPPRWIRVTVFPASGIPIQMEVVPGIETRRW